VFEVYQWLQLELERQPLEFLERGYAERVDAAITRLAQYLVARRSAAGGARPAHLTRTVHLRLSRVDRRTALPAERRSRLHGQPGYQACTYS
jgi:hypothetical protein